LGNFRHPPNVDAVEFLCTEIVPRIDKEITAVHPVVIIGNGLDGSVRRRIGSREGVRAIGWVPSMVPYLEQARASLIPVRYGAGTKRKLIQSLMVGTPTVSTSAGVEGFKVRDGEHVLVADNSTDFAAAVRRVVTERDLWRSLSCNGRQRMVEQHGRSAADRWLRALV